MSYGEMLGWMQTFFEQIGIWDDVSVALSIVVMLATAGAVISFVRGR